MDRRRMLKVKLKALAAEAQIIRCEERRCIAGARKGYVDNEALREALYLHRIHVVRREARDTGLAYAFIRGRAYKQIEPKASTPPNWGNVKRMVSKYGNDAGFETWVQ